MAHTIALYQYTGDSRVVSKQLGTAVSEHTFLLKDGCSIDKPVISFSAPANIMATLNYAYIADFGRYYWIVDRNSTVNGVVELTLESDPWMSFDTQLRGVTATVDRSASNWQGFLYDNGYQILAYKTAAIRNFPNSIDNDTMILTTVG